MSLPSPEPGLVLSYSYLWRHEHDRGAEEGSKNRPAVIIIVRRDKADGPTIVTVVPITHSPPRAGQHALEIPPGVKRVTGLDDERSWVVLDEANNFIWPGYDLRPLPNAPDRFAYGVVPPSFFDQIRMRMLDLYQRRQVATVKRD